MNVATKIVLVASLAFLPVLGIHSWLSLRREEALFRADMERDLSLLGEHLGKVAGAEWVRTGAGGPASVLRVAEAADAEVAIEWRPARPGWVSRARGLSPKDGFLLWIEPVETDGVARGEIVLRESLAPMYAYLRASLLRMGAFTFLLIGAGLAASRLLGDRLIGRRLNSLVAFAADTGAGNLGKDVDVGGRDEISRLASSLGAMSVQLADAHERAERTNAERLLMLQHLRHADRLATLGRLAGGVAHELGTPLNVVLGHADRIADASTAADKTKASAETIRRQVKRMEATIREILGFARKPPVEDEVVDFGEVARSVRDLLDPLAGRRGVDVEVVPNSEMQQVYGRSVQLEQALSNIVTNAVDASPEGGRVEIEVSREERLPRAGGVTRIVAVARVRDQGKGVPESEVDRLFDAFYTSKPPGQGTGLGLWLAEGIVRDHGGWIEVENRPDGGACFAMMIPEARDD